MRKLRLLLMPYIFSLYKVVFAFFKLFPLKNKVVATTMRGRKFSDNPRFIIEALHELDPNIDIVWFVDERYDYATPSWVRRVPYYGYGMLKRIYEMATAKVWINSHMYEVFVQKKKSQLFIQTFHGSIVFKKIYLDIKGYNQKSESHKEVVRTSKMTDVFISNSKYNNELFSRALAYKGKFYQCGFPRNDELVKPSKDYRTIVREELELKDKNIFLYAPTFRDEFEKKHYVDYSVYDIDFQGVLDALNECHGGEWVILVKFHPIMQNYIDEKGYFRLDNVKNVTSYVNMQALLAASDFVLTDYSSSVFDSAIAGVPGFVIGLDYDRYMEDRDVYFKMEDLPFPFARTNVELINNIRGFDKTMYEQKWNHFKKEIGLTETGHAALDIAKKINQCLQGESVVWE